MTTRSSAVLLSMLMVIPAGLSAAVQPTAAQSAAAQPTATPAYDARLTRYPYP